ECLLLRGCVAGKRRVSSKGHHVVAIEASVQAMQLLEGSYEETRTSEQKRTERNLKDDDRLPAAPSATRARATQSAVYTRAQDGECECSRNKHRGQRRDGNGKQKGAPVQPKVCGKRKASRDDIP